MTQWPKFCEQWNFHIVKDSVHTNALCIRTTRALSFQKRMRDRVQKKDQNTQMWNISALKIKWIKKRHKSSIVQPIRWKKIVRRSQSKNQLSIMWELKYWAFNRCHYHCRCNVIHFRKMMNDELFSHVLKIENWKFMLHMHCILHEKSTIHISHWFESS